MPIRIKITEMRKLSKFKQFVSTNANFIPAERYKLLFPLICSTTFLKPILVDRIVSGGRSLRVDEPLSDFVHF